MRNPTGFQFVLWHMQSWYKKQCDRVARRKCGFVTDTVRTATTARRTPLGVFDTICRIFLGRICRRYVYSLFSISWNGATGSNCIGCGPTFLSVIRRQLLAIVQRPSLPNQHCKLLWSVSGCSSGRSIVDFFLSGCSSEPCTTKFQRLQFRVMYYEVLAVAVQSDVLWSFSGCSWERCSVKLCGWSSERCTGKF